MYLEYTLIGGIISTNIACLFIIKLLNLDGRALTFICSIFLAICLCMRGLLKSKVFTKNMYASG